MENSKYKSMVLIYFVMIPFLHPRGFDEYFSVYGLVFKAWQYIAAIFIAGKIVFDLRDKIKLNCYLGAFVCYYIIMFSETLVLRHTFSEGIQKIFLIPFLVLYTYKELETNPRFFIHAVNNINAVNFILNLTVFSPLIWKNYFKPMTNHLTFLGHVQICAQVGILSFLFLFLEYYLYPQQHNMKRFVGRMLLTLLTMLTAFTSAAYLAIVLIVIFFLIQRIKLRKLFTYSGNVYIVGFVILNIFFMLYISFINIDINLGPISMSGRGYIWRESLNLIRQSPVYGYGVHGVLVKVFWHKWLNNSNGMNYMHNQTLQVLCDGGLLLMVPFFLMMATSIKSIDKIKDQKLRFWVIVCIMVMLIIMTFESSLEYLYGHILIATFVQIPFLSSDPRLKLRKYSIGMNA